MLRSIKQLRHSTTHLRLELSQLPSPYMRCLVSVAASLTFFIDLRRGAAASADALLRRSAVGGSGALRSVGPMAQYLQPLPAVGPPLLTSLSDPSPLTGGGPEGEERPGDQGQRDSGAGPVDHAGPVRRYAVRQAPGAQQQPGQQQQQQQQHDPEFYDYFAEP